MYQPVLHRVSFATAVAPLQTSKCVLAFRPDFNLLSSSPPPPPLTLEVFIAFRPSFFRLWEACRGILIDPDALPPQNCVAPLAPRLRDLKQSSGFPPPVKRDTYSRDTIFTKLRVLPPSRNVSPLSLFLSTRPNITKISSWVLLTHRLLSSVPRGCPTSFPYPPPPPFLIE